MDLRHRQAYTIISIEEPMIDAHKQDLEEGEQTWRLNLKCRADLQSQDPANQDR